MIVNARFSPIRQTVVFVACHRKSIRNDTVANFLCYECGLQYLIPSCDRTV